MSHSLLRLAPLSLSLSLVACVAQDTATEEPITTQESTMATGAVEGTVVAMAPITSGGPASVAAAYRASFGLDGARCATVETDNLTFVTVTFACAGPLATTGSIHLELKSATTLEASADLSIGGTDVNGSLLVTIPAAPGAQGSFDGEISITGPRRTLTADASASWTVNGSCVTYSASGEISAEGPRRSASTTFDVNAKTVCHP
jgi:hypothetical protein